MLKISVVIISQNLSDKSFYVLRYFDGFPHEFSNNGLQPAEQAASIVSKVASVSAEWVNPIIFYARRMEDYTILYYTVFIPEQIEIGESCKWHPILEGRDSELIQKAIQRLV